MTRRAPTWRDDGRTAEGNRRPAYQSTEVSKCPVELDPTPSPKQASKRNLASDFMGRPEPLGGSEALRYLVEIGIKSYKPTWDGRPPKRAGHLCGALPDELEDVQAVLCDGRVE